MCIFEPAMIMFVQCQVCYKLLDQILVGMTLFIHVAIYLSYHVLPPYCTSYKKPVNTEMRKWYNFLWLICCVVLYLGIFLSQIHIYCIVFFYYTDCKRSVQLNPCILNTISQFLNRLEGNYNCLLTQKILCHKYDIAKEYLMWLVEKYPVLIFWGRLLHIMFQR